MQLSCDFLLNFAGHVVILVGLYVQKICREGESSAVYKDHFEYI